MCPRIALFHMNHSVLVLQVTNDMSCIILPVFDKVDKQVDPVCTDLSVLLVSDRDGGIRIVHVINNLPILTQ